MRVLQPEMLGSRSRNCAWAAMLALACTLPVLAWPEHCQRQVQSAIRLRVTTSTLDAAVEELSWAILPSCMQAIVVLDVSGAMPDLSKAGAVLVEHQHTMIVVVGATTSRDFDLTKLGFVHSGADTQRSSITTTGTAKASTVGSAIILDVSPGSDADNRTLERACSSGRPARAARRALADLWHQSRTISSESGTGSHTFNPKALLGRLQRIACETGATALLGRAAGAQPWCEEATWRGGGVAQLRRCDPQGWLWVPPGGGAGWAPSRLVLLVAGTVVFAAAVAAWLAPTQPVPALPAVAPTSVVREESGAPAQRGPAAQQVRGRRREPQRAARTRSRASTPARARK